MIKMPFTGRLSIYSKGIQSYYSPHDSRINVCSNPIDNMVKMLAKIVPGLTFAKRLHIL